MPAIDSSGPAANVMHAQPPVVLAPTVAVCGLHGGAGASTVALMLAHAQGAPTLLCDVGGPTSSLWAHAPGVMSLADAADEIGRTGALSAPLIVQASDGLSVVSAPPSPLPSADVSQGMSLILQQAAGRHELVVCDCGTLTHAAQVTTLTLCDRVVWVVDLAVASVARARAALLATPADAPVRQYIAARGVTGRAARRELSDLAAALNAPIALIEPIASQNDLDAAIEQAGIGFDHLFSEIRR